MTPYTIANNVRVALSASIIDTDTSITVNAAVSPYSDPPAPVTNQPGALSLTDSFGAPTKYEVVTYTGRVDNMDGTWTLTGVTRAAEGSTAQSWAAGTFGYQAPTKSLYDQIIASARLLGRSTAGVGSVEELTIGSGLSLAAGVLSLASAINPATIGATTPGTATIAALTVTTGATFTCDELLQKSSPQIFLRSQTAVKQYYLGANISDAVDGGLVIGSGSGITGGTLIAKFTTSAVTLSNALIVAGASAFGNAAAETSSGYKILVRGAGSKTTTTVNNCIAVVSNDDLVDDPLQMDFAVIGNSTASSRYARIQVGEYSTGNFRTLSLNPSGGDVGIGTTSPGAKLDVTGAVRASIGFEYNSEADDGSSGTSKTINWTTGHRRKLLLSGNCTITFTAPAKPCSLILKLVTDASSGATQTITWPASVKWAGGVIPDHKTGNSKTHLFTFYYDGTNYLGSALPDFA